MRWKRGHVSSDVEDRRGRSVGKRGAALGGGSIVVAAIVVLLSGGSLKDLLGLASQGGGGGGASSSSADPGPRSPEEQKLYEFISWSLDDQQDTWEKVFRQEGMQYQRAKLVVFKEGVQSACGFQDKGVGPFYCPGDQNAYIDLSFYKELAKLGGPGDFAQAYVLAHEIGHHVQKITGTSDKVRKAKARSKSQANALSVLTELQADCYAGIWAHSAAKRNILEMGDLEEGLKAAAAIGDDTLAKRAGRRVSPESWTHGSSAQRVKWFRVGFESGQMSRCNTFEQ